MQLQRKLKTKRVLIILSVIVLLLVGYQLFQTARFRLVSTSPSLSSVPDIVPYIDLNFNKSLSIKDAHIQVSPNVMKSFTVTGKTLRISLLPTTDRVKYSIVISGLQSTSGQTYSGDLVFVSRRTSGAGAK